MPLHPVTCRCTLFYRHAMPCCMSTPTSVILIPTKQLVITCACICLSTLQPLLRGHTLMTQGTMRLRAHARQNHHQIRQTQSLHATEMIQGIILLHHHALEIGAKLQAQVVRSSQHIPGIISFTYVHSQSRPVPLLTGTKIPCHWWDSKDHSTAPGTSASPEIAQRK